MRNLIKINFFKLLIISFSTLVSCDLVPDFDFNIPEPMPIDDFQINTINKLNHELTSRVWKMTNIHVNSTNPNFLDYKITFNQDYSLKATNGEVIYYGNWSISDSNLNEDTLTDLKLNLVFYSPTIFDQMSKNWTVISFATHSYNGNQIDIFYEIEFHYISDGVTNGSFFLHEIK